MEEYKIEIIESIALIVSFLMLRFVLTRTIEKVALNFSYQKPRVKIIKKIINILLIFVAGGILTFIWGVDRTELIYLVSTLLTILGIAFFAQWSIISNITSTLIIFFSHPATIGDTITVMDKDFSIEGRISDIGAFFVILKTADGEKVSIPSNVFIQKIIKRKGPDRPIPQ
ncbi:MAG: mechanosensitive ion channel [Flavobacteriales bacterium]|nr:mechanosensitive ion channel [Flavobacteriales bacterium]